MLAIINAELVMKDHFIPEAVLFVEDGVIQGFGEMRNTPIPEGCEILDVQGAYVGPGLIDTHNHAGGDKWVFSTVRYDGTGWRQACDAMGGGHPSVFQPVPAHRSG